MAIENPKTMRILRLVLMLCGHRHYTLAKLMDLLSISERTVYRDLDTLERVGFDVERNGGQYRISPASATRAAINTMQVELEDLELDRASRTIEVQSKSANVDELLVLVKKIWNAINQKKQVVLLDYRSSSGGKISTRVVEPFGFSPEHQGIWAFEPVSNMCKQFKITRLSDVDILNKEWQFENMHRLPFTDLFNISADRPIEEVELELQLNAYNLLLEEFPGAKEFIVSTHPYVLQLPVAGYEGVGRFVLGLIDSIKVRRTAKFKKYLKEKMNSFQ